jgi:hypothetical protein
MKRDDADKEINESIILCFRFQVRGIVEEEACLRVGGSAFWFVGVGGYMRVCTVVVVVVVDTVSSSKFFIKLQRI